MSDQSDLRGLQDYHTNPTAHTAVIVHVAPRWIAVSERLPAVGPDKYVSERCNIIAIDDRGRRYVSSGYYFDADTAPYWIDVFTHSRATVTHWQPLPDLPEVSR